MLGHSFGGILAYEYAKSHLSGSSENNEDENLLCLCTCLSLTLANAPSNMKISLDEYTRLEGKMKDEVTQEKMRSKKEFDSSDASFIRDVQDRLRRRNECRTEKMPHPLTNAIQSRGSVWYGPEAVSDYVALPPLKCSDRAMPPVLLIRGEFDFITEKCVEGWRNIFANDPCGDHSRRTTYREVVMNDCAHYCHLEDGESFGDLVKKHCFIHDY